MSMCLSFGGNSDDTIDTSDVSEDPSSVRVKLKNETPSFGGDETNFRIGAIGDADEPADILFPSDVDSPSASSSLESGVGIPIGRTVGGESFSEFLRDKGRLLL
jgi:hypothetical protein